MMHLILLQAEHGDRKNMSSFHDIKNSQNMFVTVRCKKKV